MFFHLVMSVAQRKNSESPWGIQPQTFGFVLWFEVQFLVGTQNFFFVPRSWQEKKKTLSKINDILISYPSICSFIHSSILLTQSLTLSLIRSFTLWLYIKLNVWMWPYIFFLIQKLHKIFWKWWKSAPTDLKERSVPLPTWRQDKWWFKVIC